MKSHITQLIKYAIFYAMLFGVIAFGNYVHASEYNAIKATYVGYTIKADSNGYTDKIASTRIVVYANGTIKTKAYKVTK